MRPHLLTSLGAPLAIEVDDAVTLARVTRIAARAAGGAGHRPTVVMRDDGPRTRVDVDGVPAALLDDHTGGLWWIADGQTADLLGAPAPLPEGRLGLICDDLATVEHVAAHLTDEGLGFAAVGVTGGEVDATALLDALDAAAEVDAWVLATDHPGPPADFAAACRRIAVHRPVVTAWPGPAGSVAEDAWRDALPSVEVAALDDAVQRAAGLTRLGAPAGPMIGVFAVSDGVAVRAAEALARVGARPQICADPDPIEAAALQRERLDHDLIVVIAPPGSGAAVRALVPSDLVDRPDLPMIVVAADRDTRVRARGFGLCAVGTLHAAATLLGAMSRWGRAAQRALTQLEPTGRIADPSRFRRAVATARRRGYPAVEDGPDVAAALGLPMADRRTVRWPDDAMLAASGWGYPVDVASVEPPVVERAEDAEALHAAVARRLAAARARAGADAAIEVRAVAPGARRWSITLVHDERWGAALHAQVDERARAWTCPIDDTFGDGLVDTRPTRAAIEREALGDVARALDAVAATVHDAPTISIELDIDDLGGRVVGLTLVHDD